MQFIQQQNDTDAFTASRRASLATRKVHFGQAGDLLSATFEILMLTLFKSSLLLGLKCHQ